MIIPQELILTITENVSVEELQAIRIKIEGRRAVSPHPVCFQGFIYCIEIFMSERFMTFWLLVQMLYHRRFVGAKATKLGLWGQHPALYC